MTVENGVPETVQTGEIPTWMHCVFTEVNIPHSGSSAVWPPLT